MTSPQPVTGLAGVASPAAVGPPVVVAPADSPVALLPVGLETRFDGNTLLIRIFPDEIHVEDHEPELTRTEVAVGRQFWDQVWRGGATEPAATSNESQAWTRLVQAIGNSRRASWVADQTAPTGGTRPDTPVSEGTEFTDPPVFPDPPQRDGPWTHPAIATTLPDRFVAIAYQRTGAGGQVTYVPLAAPASGSPVADQVQLGFDPGDARPAVTDDGPALPDGMRWLIDPHAAEAAGLLIRMPLPPGIQRIDRLVVLGILTSADAATSAARLARLLTGHHHSAGLSLVPIGTPSNNTAAERAGFSRAEDPASSFAVERRTPAPADGTDGALLAAALGIPAGTLRGVAHSGDTEQAAAGQLNALLWPATLGYWLETLIQPGPGDAAIEDLRSHTVGMIRGRGPLPPIRIGQQPYGILPVTSLRNWRPGTEPAGVIRAAELIRTALPWWIDGIDRAPKVRAGSDPDQGILDLLSQAPVSASAGVRSMLGANACFVPHPVFFAGDSPADEASRQRWLSLVTLRTLGVPGLLYGGQLVAQTSPMPLLRLPYTVDPGRKPGDAAADWVAITAYLRGLRGRRTRDLQAEDPRTLTSLITLLARRSVMLERIRSGIADTGGTIAGALVEAHVRTDDQPVLQAQLVSTTATLRIGDTRSAAGAILAGSVRQDDGTMLAMTDHLDRQLVLGDIDLTVHRHYADTVAAAEAAAELEPDRAALLLGESLDIASHRIDTWITSLATRRLADMRAAQARPAGITLGAYGAVEDLTRGEPRPAVRQPPAGAPTPLVEDATGGGYIHAPSIAQAATAAVLRAGHLAHAARDPDAAALAIDLSSSRVRTALGLLDGVREGQSLGALLGYRTERMLHEAGAHTAVEIIRQLAPPPAITVTETPESLPLTSVCDGLALSRLDPDRVLSAVASADRPAVQTVLESLDDATNAVADLLLAEGVHQIVRGNPERAAGALDTLNRGEGGIAEPEVVMTPRTGTSLTHRVLVLLAADPPSAPGWPTDGVRAQAEPRLAAWAGHLLGSPSEIQLNIVDGATTHPISLSDLHTGALDLLYEPLGPRALRAARARGASESATVDLTSPEIAAMLAMAESLHELLVYARAGTGNDLARPQDRGAVLAGPPPLDGSPDPQLSITLPDVDRGDRRRRLDEARSKLDAAVTELPQLERDAPAPAENAVADALDVLAEFGIHPGGDPARPPTTQDLIAVRAAGAATLAASAAAPDDPGALFGDGFPVLELAAPPVPATLAAALAVNPVSSAPAEVLAPMGGAAQAVASWIETHGRVRAGVGRLADVLLWARMRGTDIASGAGAVRAVQLPIEPFPDADAADRGRWVGLPFPAPLGPDPVTHLVAHTLGNLAATAGIAVLVVDEFVESVPSGNTTTSVSFGFDAPAARPPQSILIAVPPVPGQGWTMASLAEVVGETLDLAKIRMVDLSSVAWAGRLIPAIYLTEGDVASGLDLPMRELVQLASARAAAVAVKP